jgi:hypothetical protein
MGKDNDIIDVMFKAMIQFVAWIFKQLFNLLVWIITGLFNLIASAISKNKNRSDSSQSSNVSNDAVEQLYIDAKNYVNELDLASDALAKIPEIVNLFATNIITNTVLSVNKKCELLSMLNNKLQKADYYNAVFVTIIEFSYKILEGVVPSPLLLQNYNTFKQELAQNRVRDFTTYFGEIFSASGLLGSPNGKFSVDYNVFDKYDFPKYKVEG